MRSPATSFAPSSQVLPSPSPSNSSSVCMCIFAGLWCIWVWRECICKNRPLSKYLCIKTQEKNMSTSTCRFAYVNDAVLPSSDTPTLLTFLQSHPGAYTTTRTHNNGSVVLFWERHLGRLTDSTRILLNVNPNLLSKSRNSIVSFLSPLQSSRWEAVIHSLVNESTNKALPTALKERKNGEELSITALVSGNWDNLGKIKDMGEESISRVLDVSVHVGMYVPPVFGIRENGARLALVGRGRDIANAKYSDWVRLRKSLEKLRPPLATEILLSNDGDQILEGSTFNIFVVCRKDHNYSRTDSRGEGLQRYSTHPFEIQTAPIGDGVLPGVIRQVIIDLCSSNGIPLREVAPSWSMHDTWEEAFITSGLRLLQHVESIQVPLSLELLSLDLCKAVTWEKKQFKDAPGRITTMIQEEIMKKAVVEGNQTGKHAGRISE